MTVAGRETCMLHRNCFTFLFTSFRTKFKLPAKYPLVSVKWDTKPPRFHTLAFAAGPGDDEYGTSKIQISDGIVKCTPHGRRELLLVSITLSFLFPLQEHVKDFEVEAKDLTSRLRDPAYLLIKDSIRLVLTKGNAAGVLRLVFHDAATFEGSDNSGGMNGSIIYELDRIENKGLKKSLKILEVAKNMVDQAHSVSWADFIAVAGAEAVSLSGGPEIPLRLGRIDSLTPDPEGKLPEESLNAPQLKEIFQQKGFSTKELIALSGAHTLGSKGFGNPFVFDNSYYKVLLEKSWKSSGGMSSMIGLPSDRSLVEDAECLRWITKYANDQDLFFTDFKNAYIKLVNTGARWKA